jgi:prepilin-type processing-associated H-X9-DG protein
MSNLKQIGLAMHHYNDTHDCFPPAAITDENGNPLLSWRVVILPYLEEEQLYRKLHLDEPWNSPHNLAFLDQMPNVYKCPSDKSLKPGMTGYQVVVGQDTAFTPDFQGLKLSEFTDGLSNTLFVGESDHSVPWTKPEDVPAEIALHVKGLTGTHGNHKTGFNALFGDGSVKFLKSSIDPQRLYWMLTRDGGEVLSPHSF